MYAGPRRSVSLVTVAKRLSLDDSRPRPPTTDPNYDLHSTFASRPETRAHSIYNGLLYTTMLCSVIEGCPGSESGKWCRARTSGKISSVRLRSLSSKEGCWIVCSPRLEARI